MRNFNLDGENYIIQVFVVLFLIDYGDSSRHHGHGHKKRPHYLYGQRSTINPYTKTICMQLDNTLRARHKSCFLRADTGPCRADIVQWYFDVKQTRCYRFFWGGCQGNGNRFDTEKDCTDYCFLNSTALPGEISEVLCVGKDTSQYESGNPGCFTESVYSQPCTSRAPQIPYYCSLAFDYGNCFGHFNRWAWDKFGKTCKRRLYSGCGGNQNNFESQDECVSTCLRPPNNTLNRYNLYTTCVPFNVAELH